MLSCLLRAWFLLAILREITMLASSGAGTEIVMMNSQVFAVAPERKQHLGCRLDQWLPLDSEGRHRAKTTSNEGKSETTLPSQWRRLEVGEVAIIRVLQHLGYSLLSLLSAASSQLVDSRLSSPPALLTLLPPVYHPQTSTFGILRLDLRSQPYPLTCIPFHGF